MKKFISWIVGIGVLTGVGSAFTSAFLTELVMAVGDGRGEDYPQAFFPNKLDEKYTKN